MLDRLSLPRQEIAQHGRLLAAYSVRGEPRTNLESMAMYAATLPSLLFQGNDGW